MGKHMVPTRRTKIHTAKNRGKCPTRGSCNYRDNCDPQPDWGSSWHGHHVLPAYSVNGYGRGRGYMAKRVKTWIRKCYRETDWCINQSPNMIALPVWAHYCEPWSKKDLNLPCHLWGHYYYNREVRKDIHNTIWKKLRKTSKVHRDKGKSVEAELIELSKKWKRIVKGRGRRNQGTSYSWKNKGKGNWHYPFSIASYNVVRSQKYTYIQ